MAIDASDIPPVALNDLPTEALDTRTGAPAAWRSRVGAASRPEHRLAELRRLDPQAQPYGDDNFVVMHPQTRRPTLYNPRGLDLGDAASLIPEFGEMLGGALGAMGGAALGAPTGPGAIASGAAGAGLGATTGRELAERGVRWATGAQDDRSGGQQVQDAATTGAINAAAGPVLQGLGALGRKAFGGANRLVFGNRQAADVVDDYARANVPMDAASVTGNRITGGLQRSASLLPGGSGPAQQLVEAQAEAVGQGVREVAEGHAQAGARLSARPAAGAPPAAVPAEAAVSAGQAPSARLQNRINRQQASAGVAPPNVAASSVRGIPGREESGRVVQEGARRANARFDARVEELESEATRMIGRDTPVTTPAVDALRATVENELARAPASRARVLQPVLDRINALAEDVDLGLGYEAMRRVRTDLGRSLRSPNNPAAPIASDTAVYLDRLYSAMSDDLFAAARAAGPDAERALRTATRYNRFNQTVNLPALERVLDKGLDEDVFRLLMPSSGRPNAQAAERILRQLQPGERRAVTATLLDRMGTPQASKQVGQTWSVDTFMTNWAKLMDNPRSRSVLLADAGDPQLAGQLDRLLRVSQRIKDHGTTRNYPNTAAGILGGEALLGIGGKMVFGDWTGALGAALVPLAGSYLMMKGMTNPTFVRWLTNTLPQAARQNTLPRSAARQLTRMVTVNPEMRDIWERYRSTYPSAFNEDPGRPSRER